MNIASLELPIDHPRLGQPFRRDHSCFSFTPSLIESLKILSLQEDISVGIVLLAAFKALLAYYSSQETIQVIATFVSNAQSAQPQRLTLTLPSELSFSELLQQLQTQIKAASPQTDLASAVAYELKQASDFETDTLLTSAQILFQFETIFDPKLSKSLTNDESAVFDLSLSVIDSNSQLNACFEYNSSLFNRETINRFIEHYQNLLDCIVANPAQLLANLSPLSETERHQILVQWNDTQVDYPLHLGLHQLFETQVERTPNAIAVIFETEQLTYQELNHQANQLAHYLRDLGVTAEARIGICLERSLEVAVGLLGILKAGGTYVPLDPSYPEERLSFMLSDAQVTILITHSKLVPNLPRHDGYTLCIDLERPKICTQSVANPATITKAEALAYLMYTSGTTGNPKGVMVEHKNLTNYILTTQNKFRFASGDVMPCIAPFSFSISLFELLTPLLSGGTSLIFTQQHTLDMKRLNASLEKLTSLHTVPSLMRQIVTFIQTRETSIKPYQNIKRLFIGGDLVSPDLVEAMRQIFRSAEIYILYGCTEVSALCSSYRVTDNAPLEKNIVGTPLHNAVWRLYDRTQRLIPVGIAGEIYVGGAGVSRGYINRQDLTQDKFVTIDGQRFYRTGDLGRFLPTGEMEFLGRIDYQVKIRGIRIEVREIELALLQHPAVKEVVVVAHEGEAGEKRLIAYITSNLKPAPSANELRRTLKASLPDYMIPAAFMVLETFPLTPNRKVDRRALPPPSQDRPEMVEAFVAAQTPAEQKLIPLWEKALGVQPIGAKDHFFNDLGGDSLVAVRLFALIEQVFNQHLPLATLLQFPTVEQLAVILTQDKTASWSSLVPIQTLGSNPPFFWVHGAGGNVLMYQKLARYLGEDQPVYGLQARGLDGKENPLTQVEDMASLYLQEIQEIQPKGPYFLGGLSFGGMVSFEIAQKLQTQGQAVALLALIDTPGLDYPRLLPVLPRLLELLPYMGYQIANRGVLRIQNWIQKRGNNTAESALQTLDSEKNTELYSQPSIQENQDASSILEKEDLTKVDSEIDGSQSMIGKIRSLGDLLEYFSLVLYKYTPWAFLVPKFYLETGRSLPKVFQKVQEANVKAALAYKPKPYSGSLLLFRAQQQPPGCYVDPQLGWGEVVKGDIQVHEVPGYHSETLVTEEKSVQPISQQLRLALSKQHRDKPASMPL